MQGNVIPRVISFYLKIHKKLTPFLQANHVVVTFHNTAKMPLTLNSSESYK